MVFFGETVFAEDVASTVLSVYQSEAVCVPPVSVTTTRQITVSDVNVFAGIVTLCSVPQETVCTVPLSLSFHCSSALACIGVA